MLPDFPMFRDNSTSEEEVTVATDAVGLTPDSKQRPQGILKSAPSREGWYFLAPGEQNARIRENERSVISSVTNGGNLTGNGLVDSTYVVQNPDRLVIAAKEGVAIAQATCHDSLGAISAISLENLTTDQSETIGDNLPNGEAEESKTNRRNSQSGESGGESSDLGLISVENLPIQWSEVGTTTSSTVEEPFTGRPSQQGLLVSDPESQQAAVNVAPRAVNARLRPSYSLDTACLDLGDFRSVGEKGLDHLGPELGDFYMAEKSYCDSRCYDDAISSCVQQLRDSSGNGDSVYQSVYDCSLSFIEGSQKLHALQQGTTTLTEVNRPLAETSRRSKSVNDLTGVEGQIATTLRHSLSMDEITFEKLKQLALTTRVGNAGRQMFFSDGGFLDLRRLLAEQPEDRRRWRQMVVTGGVTSLFWCFAMKLIAVGGVAFDAAVLLN